MPGHYVSRVWTYDPTLDAPAKYRRACKYDAFIPLRLTGLSLKIEATVAGVVSEAEAAIRDLNAGARPALAPLARLLLRTESMASSKIEGVQTGVRELARAEAKVEAGRKASATALEVLANIDAMQLAMDDASAGPLCDARDPRNPPPPHGTGHQRQAHCGTDPDEPELDRRQRLQPLWR